MLKIYKMRIRYTRESAPDQSAVTACWQRVLASSGLPYARNESDAARAQMTFGPALPLGQSSRCEYVDLYLTAPAEEAEVLEKLSPLKECGLCAVNAKHIPSQFPSVASLSDAAEYEVTGLENFNPPPLEDFLRSEHIIIVLPRANGESVEIDLKPFIYKAHAGKDILNIMICKVDGRGLKVELFLAKWLNLQPPQPGERFEEADVKIIKKNLYYRNSLGGYTEV